MERELHESQLLLSSKRKLKRRGALRAQAARLVKIAIPFLVFAAIHTALSLWFALGLQDQVFTRNIFAGLTKGFFILAAHLTTGIGTFITCAILIIILWQRHYDVNFLWAYTVCSVVLLCLSMACLVISSVFAAGVATWASTWKRSKLGMGMGITCMVLVAIMLVYQVRRVDKQEKNKRQVEEPH
jgi:hypothetical protein